MAKSRKNSQSSNSFSKEEKHLHSAKTKLEKELLLNVAQEAFAAAAGTKNYGFENIVGVGISEKTTNGRYIGESCVVVYVIEKVTKDKVFKKALVPEKINGIKTDVVATGEIHALAHVGRYRPAPGGVSVGHFQITAGTLGCLVQKQGKVYILSNNHVLANSNNAAINDPILQPGPFDGGTVNKDTIGRLAEFIQVQFNGTPNLVDCALAASAPPLVTTQNKCIGTISSSPVAAQRFQVVKKCGRSTELSRGLVTDTNATIKVGYGTNGTAIFQNQIVIAGVPFIAPFSAPGDSGSLIVTEFGNNPVGLLFAGSFLFTIANPIQTVLSLLNVSMYT